MRKIFVVFLVLAMVSVAYAKTLTVKVEFTFDAEFEPEVSMFKLYYQEINNPSIIYHIMDITDVSVRMVNTPTFDLPPGKTSDFFVSAVYNSGEEEMSPPYSWKFTGKPTITNISR